MKAKELLSRYRQGERNFREVDLRGELLRGMNLAGIDLSGANLMKTDLRGTQFTDAKLAGAQFCESSTGTRRRWSVLVILLALALSGLAASLTGIFVAFFLIAIIEPSQATFSDNESAEVIAGTAGLGVIAIALYFNYRQGLLATLGAVAFAGAGDSSNVLLIVALTVAMVLLITFLNFIISRRALSGDPRDKPIRDLAVGLSSLGGTSFRGADLTDANFSEATVKSAHFKGAQLTRTCFHLSKKLHLSRAYQTSLANRTALNLLVSLRPEPKKSYVGLNLKGANLSNAQLADINLTEADLSEATLEGADMQRANLTKVQALGTCFHQTDLNAACLEAWNIDSTTQLAGTICEHIYLLQNQQERRPSSGTFAPGEFTKLFEEVLNTIDLIFRDGIDWRAFLQTFQNIQVQHEGANLEIQSIENKGDGVMVVRLNANPEADKSTIHQAFKQQYQKALKAVERKYKALLQSKEQEIQHKEALIDLHRQQSADMTLITKSLAERPVTVDVNATAKSEAMQGNDQSQSVTVGGDFNINADNSIVSLRDTSGQVSNQINQLGGSETQAQLKDLLTQLQSAIETEPALSKDEKADALEEVKTIAEAGQLAEATRGQKRAKRAMNALKGMTTGLTETTKLVEVCGRLLPMIRLLFGL